MEKLPENPDIILIIIGGLLFIGFIITASLFGRLAWLFSIGGGAISGFIIHRGYAGLKKRQALKDKQMKAQTGLIKAQQKQVISTIKK